YKADRPSWRFRFARWLEIKAIRNACLVIAISENTARDVTRILGVPSDRIAVTPLGVDDRFFRVFDREQSGDRGVLAPYSIGPDRKTLLYVGGIDQRKNALFMLDTVRALKDRYIERGESPPVLVCAGQITQDRQ
ncbi:glycosyltransferase, partial [Staphylococcus aureus]|uniref:glycosyltransferase n=1 Tax=Staphylococcus aureus TaxID=1280 RepID=UPI0039BE79D7